MISFIKNYGVLGINARNLLYIKPYNSKKAIKFADSKLKTKQFLSAREIPVPKLYAVIKSDVELYKFDFSTLPAQCVLKPNLGFGGEGIIPFLSRKNSMYEKSSGILMSQEELYEHMNDILEGRFSITGVPDTAFFEQLIVCDDRIAKYSYKGLPDIRIVVHNLIPVMAMLRLPTVESDGKANLHLGAIGVGIDIANGTATHIVKKSEIIHEIPGIGSIKGFKVPYWNEILLIASKAQLSTNLGYMAVDIAIDKSIGPVLLEINARAGLSVQIANLAPLRKRLERVAGLNVSTPEKGVRMAQDMFGYRIEKEVKKISGKQVIGNREKVYLIDKDGTRIIWASINPLLEKSLIDRSLGAELFPTDELDAELKKVKIKFSLGGERIQTIAELEDLSGKPFELVLGRRDLQGFLIDPSKGKDSNSKLPKFIKSDFQESRPDFLFIDKTLISVDRQIKLLHHIRPNNLNAEREKFLSDPSYNPQFEYDDLSFDTFSVKEKLKKLEVLCDDSQLAKLFLGKISEIKRKIDLLESIGTDRFFLMSQALYGLPDTDLMAIATEKINLMPKSFPNENLLSFEETIVRLEGALKQYSLNDWKVKIKNDMVSDCTAGKHNCLFLRDGVRFSEDRLRMVIAHEIETHILTAVNGAAQNYAMFGRGFGDYIITQEGLAVWNQEHVIDHDVEKNYRSASLVLIVDYAINHSFSETVEYCYRMEINLKKAFRIVSKVKRGLEDTSQEGAFTKDINYFAGYLQIENFVSKGGNLKDLYYGKYNLKDLDAVKSIENLKEPDLLPSFLLSHS